MTVFYNHLCDNCKVWLEDCDSALCSACQYLAQTGLKRGLFSETEGLVNRRWQLRFNRGELDRRECCNAGVKWERKRKYQDW